MGDQLYPEHTDTHRGDDAYRNGGDDDNDEEKMRGDNEWLDWQGRKGGCTLLRSEAETSDNRAS